MALLTETATLRGQYIPTTHNSFAQWLGQEVISEYDKV